MTGIHFNNRTEEMHTLSYTNLVCKDYLGKITNLDRKMDVNTSVAGSKTANPVKPLIHKLFTMRNGTIDENLLHIRGQKLTSGFINSCSGYPVSGLIILIDSRFSSNDFFSSHPGLQKIVRHIIRYNAVVDTKISDNESSTEHLVKSLGQAVCKSYELVENNQAILVADVEPDFDFFGHFD